MCHQNKSLCYTKFQKVQVFDKYVKFNGFIVCVYETPS
jgi:hypothetical protein